MGATRHMAPLRPALLRILARDAARDAARHILFGREADSPFAASRTPASAAVSDCSGLVDLTDLTSPLVSLT